MHPGLWLPGWLRGARREAGHSAIVLIQYQVEKYRQGWPSVPYEVIQTGPNKIVDVGLTFLVKLARDEIATHLDNANARTGSGDSSTAATAGQTNLQAVTNKTWVAMDASYPTAVASQATTFRSTFAAGTGTWTWNEVGLAYGDPGAAGTLIGRKVQSFGAKAAGDAWILTCTMTFASGT